MNVKLFIASPAFDGKTHATFTIAFAQTLLLCAKNHINIEYQIATSGSLLCAERNRLIKGFLVSDCTHMLCVDSDLGWPPEAVIGMLKYDEPFVAGCYPARGSEKVFLFRAENNENGSLKVSEKKLIEMTHIPAGFMLIKREVIEKIIQDNPELYFKPKKPEEPDGFCLFNTMLKKSNGEFNEFWGEDFVFCDLVRKSGFKIYVDPMIQFNHAGNVAMLIEALTNVPEEKKEV